ncbi:MAG TPA: VOC family protein [Marmoricola sp.]|nr:VOC family protein [Marmoricola sp.]
MNLSWLTAFLDFRPASFDAGAAFWAGVTAATLSAPRGEHDEFATLLPPSGEPWLRVQRLQSAAPARVHLDLHAHDPAALRRLADGLGAVLVHDAGFASYTSPGGLPFCLVSAPGGPLPEPVDWGTHRSRADQVCLDLPHRQWEREVDFWSSLTGLEVVDVEAPEFLRLDVPASLPLKLLLQRRDDDAGPVRAHLDLATDDPIAEVARLRELGAVHRHEGARWTTLADPTGLELCVTHRRP